MEKRGASKPRIRSTTPFNHERFGEVNTKKSMTVADQSVSVKEILEKWTLGIDPMYSRYMVDGNEDADFDDIDLGKVGRMDRPSQLRIHAEHLEKVNRAKKELARVEAEKKEFEKKAEIEPKKGVE